MLKEIHANLKKLPFLYFISVNGNIDLQKYYHQRQRIYFILYN